MNTKSVKIIGVGCLCAYLFVVYCPIHGQAINSPSGFGYVGTASVTASGVSQQVSQSINWTPVKGPIAAEQVAFDYQGHSMEIKREVRNNG